MAKILLIIAVLVSLATAGLGYLNKQKLTEAQTQLSSVEGTLNTRTKELTETKTQLGEATEAAAAATAAREKVEADLAAAQTELATAKEVAEQATGQVAQLESEVESQKGQIAQLEEQVTILTASAGQPDGSPAGPGLADDSGTRIQELEALVSSLESTNQNLREKVGTFEKQESARREKQMRDGLEGQVLAVNPAWNFVVLSIGDREGVVNNAELLLKRGGQYLGKVRVTSVEPSTSIADIVANTVPQGVAVQPGDSVIYQSSSN